MVDKFLEHSFRRRQRVTFEGEIIDMADHPNVGAGYKKERFLRIRLSRGSEIWVLPAEVSTLVVKRPSEVK